MNPNVKLIAEALESVAARISLQQKLHPQRCPGMSPLMAALVGFIIGASFVTPSISEIAITSDGSVFAATDDGANLLIGTYEDLFRNWLALLTDAGLTTGERNEADALFAAKIGYFGGMRS
jgi:hypothetical protein